MNATKSKILLQVENIESFVKDFEDFMDEVLYCYLAQSCAIAGYIYSGVTDNRILEVKLEEHFIDFKNVCEKISKFKVLKKFVFLPCEDLERNQVTIDERIEFLFNYANDKTFMNKKQLESYNEVYERIGKNIIYIDKFIQYGTDIEFINLKNQITEIKEKLYDNNVNLDYIITEFESIKETFKAFEVEAYYDILNSYNQEVKIQNDILVKEYYYKYVMKKQETFKYNNKKCNKTDCPICLEDFENGRYVTKLKCRHYFCTKCIEKWFKESVTCPYCKRIPEFSPEC